MTHRRAQAGRRRPRAKKDRPLRCQPSLTTQVSARRRRVSTRPRGPSVRDTGRGRGIIRMDVPGRTQRSRVRRALPRSQLLTQGPPWKDRARSDPTRPGAPATQGQTARCAPTPPPAGGPMQVSRCPTFLKPRAPAAKHERRYRFKGKLMHVFLTLTWKLPRYCV